MLIRVAFTDDPGSVKAFLLSCGWSRSETMPDGFEFGDAWFRVTDGGYCSYRGSSGGWPFPDDAAYGLRVLRDLLYEDEEDDAGREPTVLARAALDDLKRRGRSSDPLDLEETIDLMRSTAREMKRISSVPSAGAWDDAITIVGNRRKRIRRARSRGNSVTLRCFQIIAAVVSGSDCGAFLLAVMGPDATPLGTAFATIAFFVVAGAIWCLVSTWHPNGD